jgi:NAD(P)-dependent dehydrogenase (short-subunit alcohol dehydrogenase family)
MSSAQDATPTGTVLLTGAASGIGRATALLLAQRGWRCVLLDRDADRLAQLKIELETQESHRHLYRVVDLTRWDELQAVTQGLPELDAVINNAGMSTPGINALETLTQEPTSRLVGLNLLAPARLIQACQYAIKPHARIVNVASGAALRAIPARGLYSPSKAGLLEQTRALAQAFPHWTVTALSPGFVRTELVQQLLDGGQLQAEQALAKIPLGRLAEPWEIAHALLFLATQSPHLLSGQNLSLCGGSSIYGGSQRLTVTRAACVSPNTPSLIRFAAPLPTPWQSIQASLGQAQDSKSAGVYVGLIDASPLLAGEGQVLETVQNAARQFFEHHTHESSLTLLMPHRSVGWEHAGDLPAAVMLISTLAVEWGHRGVRINAIHISASVAPLECLPLLRYMAGPSAQYLTGQTVKMGHNIAEVPT